MERADGLVEVSASTAELIEQLLATIGATAHTGADSLKSVVRVGLPTALAPTRQAGSASRHRWGRSDAQSVSRLPASVAITEVFSYRDVTDLIFDTADCTGRAWIDDVAVSALPDDQEPPKITGAATGE